MDAIRVAVSRGGVVEAVHLVHAAAVRDGALVAAAGDPELVAFFRSSSKPLQALPLARARDDLDSRDLAIASASHLASPDQLAAVRALLWKAPATEHDLECGHEPTRLAHNCSGKHAGMLALCRARGWPLEGYRLPEHPVQQGCLAEVAAAAEVDPATIPTAVDGCGVVTFALSLERMANAFSRLESLDAGARVAAAMRAHPELIRGPLAADTRLMQALPGWTAKGGAEGLALRGRPGRARHRAEVRRRRLARTRAGAPPSSSRGSASTILAPCARAPSRNSRGEVVGEIVVL